MYCTTPNCSRVCFKLAFLGENTCGSRSLKYLLAHADLYCHKYLTVGVKLLGGMVARATLPL